MDGPAPQKRQKVGSTAGPTPYHQVLDQLKTPGLIIQNHTFTVPLDHTKPQDGRTITVFARELVSPANKSNKSQPYLLYIQGGPGMEAPRPFDSGGWLRSALSSFRVVYMDQRGTGRSTPVTITNLARAGDAAAQAEYLSHFRADSIVRDAEMLRKALVPKDNYHGRWTIMGQSFGGFCSATYLSFAPEGLLEVLMTGGLPPGVAMPCSADAVYMACHKRVLLQNDKYYARFPADVQLVGRIVAHLAAQPGGGVQLPSGTRLTPRALQSLGLNGLGSGGGFERLHFLLEGFFDGSGDMNPGFGKAFESWQSWDSNPLYALLHESIYCQGAASAWSAQRVLDQHFSREFDAAAAAAEGRPVAFTGEMVYKWMFEDFAYLRPYKEAAELLAAKEDWGALYDASVLGGNAVPSAAISYVEDMYVDFTLASQTASTIKGLKHWCTNEYRHSGIRDDGTRIFDRLLGMVRETVLD